MTGLQCPWRWTAITAAAGRAFPSRLHQGNLHPVFREITAAIMQEDRNWRQSGMVEDGRLILPHSALAGCVALAVARDTCKGTFTPAERLNYFPATPFVSLSLFLLGETILPSRTKDSEGRISRLPDIAVFGPQRGPVVTLNPGPVTALTVAIFPDAFQALTGTQISDLVDRNCAAQDVLPQDVMAVCLAARAARDAEAAFEVFEAGLAPIWKVKRTRGSLQPRRAVDWSLRLASAAATHGMGRSLRQIERRVKDWTGQTQRDLATLRRAEQTLLSVLGRMGEDREDWAGTADAQGYSDQAHMIREVRRITGLPPEQLRRRMKTDKAFWCYRLLGELA